MSLVLFLNEEFFNSIGSELTTKPWPDLLGHYSHRKCQGVVVAAKVAAGTLTAFASQNLVLELRT